MEITPLKAEHDRKNEDLFVKSRRLSISKARRCIEEPFVRLSGKIPRHIISIDEKYLRHYLERIYLTAAPTEPSWEPISSRIPTVPVLTYNLPTGGREVVVSSGGEWVLGSISRSKSMLNILKSPLLHKKEAKAITFGSNRSEPISMDYNSSRSIMSPSSSLVTGMVHLTWKDGSPHCVFSINMNGRKETLVAKRTSNCIYVFENEFEIVGRMRLSSSVKLDQLDSEVKETEFVLFSVDNSNESTKVVKKKNSRLPRKVKRVFNTSSSTRDQNKDSCKWPRQDDHFIPNLQLVAIVVKERRQVQQEEEETKGWGLKFLKKTKKNKEDNNGLSINIIVPEGIHGGPRLREGGPSTLLQRWRSDGKCDCEGWDMGCSYKVLQTKFKPGSQLPPSFEFFIKGSNEVGALPAIKIDTEDSLYIIQFETGISPLQSFATAVAISHCRNPQLKTQ